MSGLGLRLGLQTQQPEGTARTRSDAKKLGNGPAANALFHTGSGHSARFRGDSGGRPQRPANKKKPVRNFAWHWDRANEKAARVVLSGGCSELRYVRDGRRAARHHTFGVAPLPHKFLHQAAHGRPICTHFASRVQLAGQCATDRNLAPCEIRALPLPPTALPVRANIAHPPQRMTVPSKSYVPPSHLHRTAAP